MSSFGYSLKKINVFPRTSNPFSKQASKQQIGKVQTPLLALQSLLSMALWAAVATVDITYNTEPIVLYCIWDWWVTVHNPERRREECQWPGVKGIWKHQSFPLPPRFKKHLTQYRSLWWYLCMQYVSCYVCIYIYVYMNVSISMCVSIVMCYFTCFCTKIKMSLCFDLMKSCVMCLIWSPNPLSISVIGLEVHH